MNWKVKLNGTFFITSTFLTVGLFFVVFLIYLQNTMPPASLAVNGRFTVPDSITDNNTLISGEWHYAEGTFIMPGDSTAAFEPVTTPHTWERGLGHGTYRLVLENLVPATHYSLYLKDIPSAYTLYVDGLKAAETGVPGAGPSEEKFHLQPTVIQIIPQTSQVELLLQVSNYHTASGGLTSDITFGLTNKVHKLQNQNMNLQMFLMGAIMIMAAYNLCLFILNPKEKSAFYFFLANIMVSARILFTGERLINQWFVQPNWDLLYMLQFTIGGLMLTGYALFLYSMFPDYINRRLILAIVLISGLVCILPAFVPVLYLGLIDILYLAAAILLFAHVLIALIRCLSKKVLGSTFSFIGIVFILISTLIDSTTSLDNVIPIAIMIFIIFQSLAIAEKYTSLAEQNQLLNYVATRDGMTNLYKREHFFKLVNGIIDSEVPVIQHAIMFIDIDNFKTINDSYGHDVGDQVIVTFAERLTHALRYSDIASRYGGDEFVVWLHNTKDEDCEFIAHRILEQIQAPIVINAQAIKISSSIGIAFYPSDGATLEELLVTSDRRMYAAKKQGKNTYVYRD